MRRNPQTIAENLDDFPGDVLDDIIGIVADAWSTQDVDSTLDWITTLDSSAKQDQATEVLIRNIMWEDPVRAELLVTNIHDSVLRSELSNAIN